MIIPASKLDNGESKTRPKNPDERFIKRSDSDSE